MWRALLAGAGTGLSLIVAIGAQNAYLLRVGLSRRYVLRAVVICITGDVTLIALGVGGVGGLLLHARWIIHALTIIGALYLGMVAVRSWRAAVSTTSGLELDQQGISSRDVTTTVLAMTFLNPHVYLDTVVFLGTISTHFGSARWGFGFGAMMSSVLWFTTLGLGARRLAPLLRSAATWRWLDAVIGCVVAAVAISLLVR